MVTDLEKLSRAVSDATPEKATERELNQKAQEIREALERDGVYEDHVLGFRNPSHQVTSYPAGIARQGRGMMVPWAEVTVRMAMLNDFISELRD